MKLLLVAFGGAVVGSMLSISIVGQAQSSKTPSAVAFVSANRIFTETQHGRSQVGRIQALQQQTNTDLRAKQQALDATRQQFATATEPAARAQLQQKEVQQRTEFERATIQAQTDLTSLQREVNTDLQQRVRTALDDLMKTQNYQLIVNSDTTVLWSVPELDLTSAVVARMNGQ